MTTPEEHLASCSSAEDFLQALDIAHDPAVVRVNRLHILKRYHDYLDAEAGPASLDQHRACLRRAYEDFVTSDAVTEKVFKVFQDAQKPAGFVPLSSLEEADSPARDQ